MATGDKAVAVLCGWEGNRGSGVALAIRHRLRVMEHPAYPPVGVRHALSVTPQLIILS